MAKHNLFLGTGSGSVGDVVVMRREGVQVQRVRVREIANPKTVGQASQRNFLAPVAKFYAPFAVALEKSWEGLNKSKSYSAFLKKNIERARANGYYLPKGQAFFPMPYQLSNGTLPSIRAICYTTNHSIEINGDFSGVTGWGEFSQKMIDNFGLENGDQLTFIAVGKVEDGVYIPMFDRMYLDISSVLTMAAQFENSPFKLLGTPSATTIEFDSKNSNTPIVACAVIASRWDGDKWRRSIEYLECDRTVIAAITGAAAEAAAIDSYRDSATANASDVYLNGSNG